MWKENQESRSDCTQHCRYELYCMAKSASTRYCVTHCELPTEVSRGWNTQRGDGGYSPDVFEDLAGRFESPDTKNRWDVPLVRVDPRSKSLATDVQLSIAVITGTSPPPPTHTLLARFTYFPHSMNQPH